MIRPRSCLSEALVRAASTVRVEGPWPRLYGAAPRWPPRGDRTAREFKSGMVLGARSPKLARVEAALFAAGEPLTTRRIADVAGLSDGAEARVLVQELQTLYDADATAFTVESVAGGWQLRTRPEFSKPLSRLHPHRSESRITQPALETLAVVAYRQPVLRADIEAIRGVSCGEMLRQLIDRGLVRIVGHHDSLGRPLLYGTTRRFLEIFGLADLGSLPLADQLRSPAHKRAPSEGALEKGGHSSADQAAVPDESKT